MNSLNQEYNRFIKMPYFVNYGFLPQTFESPNKTYFNEYHGDNDPLDCLDISLSRVKIGEIVQVKVVGSFCLIDQGEVDWKILCVNNEMLKLNKINENDYFTWFKEKGFLDGLMNKFKVYKTLEGKKANFIYNNDKVYSSDETIKVVEEANSDYREFIKRNK